MASTKDIHDIMGMGMGGGPVQKPASKKKKKVVETQPRLSGISREVQALMGDSVPPVQIVEAPKYKSKPSLASKLYKPRHWEERSFTPGARGDGLVLKHWKRALPLQRTAQTNGDVEMADGEKDSSRLEYQFEDEFPMEKWDVSIRVPEYNDEQYDKHFKVDDWTREETDYLMRLASEYDLRWILIADRYDPQDIQPPAIVSESAEDIKAYSERTMEQLKLRYYQVAAQDLELRTPKSTMNPSEFALFEKMRNFDAKTEGLRKTMAEKLFERTKDEAEEERTLLEELHRITKNEEDFINMRRDLYARLEAAPSLRRNERGEEQNIVLSSAGLSELLSRLFAKDKHYKRRLPMPGETGSNAQQSTADGRGRSNTQASRRDTMDALPEPSKKGSISHQPVPKQLTKADEEKYGVTHPSERLTSGVSFRHEKINRVTTAKSQVQTQKINAALTELEIPARLSMPTDKVCREFERLVGQIQLLLDARKTLTRVSEEVKTLEEMRRQRLGEPAPTDQQTTGDAMDTEKATSSAGQAHTSGAGRDGLNDTEDSKIEPVEGEPGPAIHEDDDDAEAEDDVEASNTARTQDEDDEDDEEQDETQVNDDSVMQKDEDEEDEEDEDNEDEENGEDQDDNEEDEEEDDDDDDEGTAALRRGAENDDDEEEEDEDEDDEDEPHEPLVEEEDEDEDEDDDDDEASARPQRNGEASEADEEEDDNDEEEEEEEDVTMNEVEPAEGDPDMEEEEVEESRPASASSRSHKRGASVVSDASGAGSNRSGIGRKRKR